MGQPAPAPYQSSPAAMAGQFGAGSQEGIAQMLGFPVDAVAGGISGIGELTGLWDRIENPVGGSASIGALLEPFRAGIPEPQTAGERMSRRIGEEVGASVTGAPLLAAAPVARANPVAAALAEGASALGSGTGAAIANEVAPDSATAEILAALAGGVTGGMGASRALGLDGQSAQMTGGTMQGQQQRARDAYGVVEADTSILGPQRATDLELGIIDKAIKTGIDPDLTPGSATLERVISRRINPNMTIQDVEDLRRLTMGTLPATASPADQRVAQALKAEITDYLDSLGTPATEALREGRDATRRTKAAEAVLEATGRAERRAATTGSGGNEINAVRQNLRSILDNPSKRRSFTQSELAQIEQVVMGTGEQNLMRRLSRFAPSSGGLASMLGIGGTMASAPVALPIIAATEGAKMLGERSTRQSVDALVRSLLGERVTATSQQGISPVLQALLSARTMSGGE